MYDVTKYHNYHNMPVIPECFYCTLRTAKQPGCIWTSPDSRIISINRYRQLFTSRFQDLTTSPCQATWRPLAIWPRQVSIVPQCFDQDSISFLSYSFMIAVFLKSMKLLSLTTPVSLLQSGKKTRMKIISMSTREMFVVTMIITCYDPFGLHTCLWLNIPQSLCSFTTCAPVKEVRLTSILSVQLMKHVSVFIYDAVVSAVMISQAHGERIQTQWKNRCVGMRWKHPTNSLLNHCREAWSVCSHKHTAGSAYRCAQPFQECLLWLIPRLPSTNKLGLTG